MLKNSNLVMFEVNVKKELLQEFQGQILLYYSKILRILLLYSDFESFSPF